MMSLEDAEMNDAPRSRYQGGLRASDTEREATAAVLRRNYTAGRLDHSEYEERLTRCYAAKWVGELADLTLDLPQETPPEPPIVPPSYPPAQPSEPRYRYASRGWWPVPLVPVLIAVVVLGALSHGHIVWPLLLFVFFWAFGPWGRRYRGDWERRRGDGSRDL